MYTQPLMYLGMLLNFLKPHFARMKSLRSEYLDLTSVEVRGTTAKTFEYWGLPSWSGGDIF